MKPEFLIFLAGALFCFILAAFAFRQNPRDFVTRIFTLGMLLLSVKPTFSALSLISESSLTALRLQHLSIVAGSFLPGIWLVFSLSFARNNYKQFLQKWKWLILCIFALPVILPTLFAGYFFQQPALFISSKESWILRLGWSGYLYSIFSLLGAVLVMINLEKTLRTSVGHIRWQIKFMILGVGSIFGVGIYTDSQAILFHTLDTSLTTINGIALLVACPMMLFSLYRSKTITVHFYLSHSALYASFTLLFVGFYLIAVALLAKAAPFFTGKHAIPSQAFFIFLVFLGLAIALFSDRLRRQLKRFVSLHFSRPFYDYRKEWTAFTRATGSVLDMNALCQAIADMVSRTLDVLSVGLWVTDESEKRLVLRGSTALATGDIPEAESAEEDLFQLAETIIDKDLPPDYDFTTDGKIIQQNLQNSGLSPTLKIQYAIPLISGDQLVGLMTVSDRIGYGPLSLEDFELLSTFADQAAGSLLTVKLSEQMRKVKEQEAFRTMSAFFIHDLKNLASKFSLTMENLPVHFDNEEFRNDTIQMMSQSVEKIKLMCNRLASLGERIELQPTEMDLNELVETTLAGFNGGLKARVIRDLKPLPKLYADPEQLQKVLTNLLLNANDAAALDPCIHIVTALRGNWIEISITDNGRGISREFMETSLFHPFKTTKKNGMGIGLFHSKMIVEAHRGRLEAESIEGKKTTFRILLPITGNVRQV